MKAVEQDNRLEWSNGEIKKRWEEDIQQVVRGVVKEVMLLVVVVMGIERGCGVCREEARFMV